MLENAEEWCGTSTLCSVFEQTHRNARKRAYSWIFNYVQKSTVLTRASFLSFSFLCVKKCEKEEHDSLRDGGNEGKTTEAKRPGRKLEEKRSRMYTPRGKFVVPGFYRCAVPPSTEPTCATMTGSVRTLIMCIFVLHVLCNVPDTRTFFYKQTKRERKRRTKKPRRRRKRRRRRRQPSPRG